MKRLVLELGLGLVVIAVGCVIHDALRSEAFQDFKHGFAEGFSAEVELELADFLGRTR